MSATIQISVTNVADTAIVAQSFCKNIRIAENRGVAGWPTSDFTIKKPTAAAVGVRIQAGANYTFNNAPDTFKPGDIAGYVRTISGTTTFDQDEDMIYQRGTAISGTIT